MFIGSRGAWGDGGAMSIIGMGREGPASLVWVGIKRRSGGMGVSNRRGVLFQFKFLAKREVGRQDEEE